MYSKILSFLICSALLSAGVIQAQEVKETTKSSVRTKADSPETFKKFPFRGKISEVDRKAKTISIKGKTVTRIFQITPKTKLMKDGKPAKFEDAVKGEIVGGYAQQTAKQNVYLTISLRIGPKPGKKSEEKTEEVNVRAGKNGPQEENEAPLSEDSPRSET